MLALLPLRLAGLSLCFEHPLSTLNNPCPPSQPSPPGGSMAHALAVGSPCPPQASPYQPPTPTGPRMSFLSIFSASSTADGTSNAKKTLLKGQGLVGEDRQSGWPACTQRQPKFTSSSCARQDGPPGVLSVQEDTQHRGGSRWAGVG